MSQPVDTEPPAAPPPGPAGADGTPAERSGVWALVRELAVVLVVALLFSMLIKTFLVQAFYIPSESMEDTLINGDKVVVSKLQPGPFDLRRGDIVVFKDPGGWITSPPVPKQRGPLGRALVRGLTFVGIIPSDSGEHLIKRLIGLPGDTVACCDDQGRLSVNGVPVDEAEYLKPGVRPSLTPFSIRVPEDRYWVMGDNRPQSADSRSHRDNGHAGTIPEGNVVGRAFVLVWPRERFRWLSNPDDVFARVPEPR